MVVIRLARAGAKKRPFYHLVAADKRCKRDGRYIERLGYFNPMASGEAIRLKLERERIDYWISVGAQPSERVASLIKDFDNPERREKRVAKKAQKREKAQAAKLATAEADNRDTEQATDSTTENAE